MRGHRSLLGVSVFCVLGSLTSSASAGHVPYRKAFEYTIAVNARMGYVNVGNKLLNATRLIADYDISCDNNADPDDPPCVVLLQNGDTGSFGQANSDDMYIIIGQTQLDQVYGINYQIKVVHSLEDVEGVPGLVGGVTKAIGTKNIVIGDDGGDDIEWAHEVGHSIGFDDVAADGCDHYLMWGTNTGVQRVINTFDSYSWEYNAPITLYGIDCGTSVGTSFVATSGNQSITLSWDEADLARDVSYVITRSDNCWGPLQPVAEIQSHDPAYTSDNSHYTYVDTGATYAHPYYYQLAVVDEVVHASATPTPGASPTPIGTPSNLTLQGGYRQGGLGTITLSWTASSGTASGYHVYRKLYAGMQDCTSGFDYLGMATTTSFQDTTAPWNGIPISYRVRGYNSTTGSGVSNEAIIVTTPIQWLADGVPVVTAANTQGVQRCIGDGLGGTILVWEDSRSGGKDIFAQRLDSAGQSMWNPNGVAICSAPYDQDVPALASDGSGGAIITWRDYRGNNPVGDIYAQRITSYGVPLWSGDGIAVCVTGGQQLSPDIVSDGSGGAIIGWTDTRSGTADIYAQRVNPSGVAQWITNGVVVSAGSGSDQDPRMVPDGTGGAVVAWRDNRNGCNCADADDIYAQRISASGTVQWMTNGVPVCTAIHSQASQSIVSDSNGGAIVGWVDQRTSTSSDIYAQRITSSGSVRWVTDGVALCTASGLQAWAKLAPDGSGGAIAAWEDWRSGAADVYAQRVDSLGAVAWTADGVQVCGSANDQRYPTIAPDNSHGAVVTWEDGRAGSLTDIYSQKVSSTGTMVWATNGTGLSTAASIQSSPQSTSDGLGGVIVVWQDLRAGNADLYAQRATPGSGSISGVDATPPAVQPALLSQNRPNPFNPLTTIEYSLPHAGHVRLYVVDISGRLVKAIVDGYIDQGQHATIWMGLDNKGRAVASGVYFMRLEFDGFTEVRRMTLLR